MSGSYACPVATGFPQGKVGDMYPVAFLVSGPMTADMMVCMSAPWASDFRTYRSSIGAMVRTGILNQTPALPIGLSLSWK